MHSLIKTAAIIILGVSLIGFWRNLPNGDLGAIFSEAAAQQAVNNGQMNLLLLVLFSFGAGVSSNYLLTGIGMRRGYGDRVGRGVVAVWFVLVIGGLVVGVISGLLDGITVPAVMNPGTGLIAGSLIGLLIAKNLN